MVDLKDYYQILGVSKNASDKEIKQAFRKLAKEYHPDTNEGDKAKEEKFKEVGEAYEVLSDPEKRQVYDTRGTQGVKDEFGPRSKTGDFWSQFVQWEGGNGAEKILDKNIWISANDTVLLEGLRIAYSYNGDGEWEVLRSKDDKREIIPNSFYRVIKKNNTLEIQHRMREFRPKKEQNKALTAERTVNGQVERVRFKPNDLVGEEYLTGKNGWKFDFISSAWQKRIAKYLEALKTVAKENRNWHSYEFQYAITEIFEWSWDTGRCVTKDDHLFRSEDMEPAVIIPFIGLKDYLDAQEYLVRKMNQNKRPEGQTRYLESGLVGPERT